jgi:hypothetical protein
MYEEDSFSKNGEFIHFLIGIKVTNRHERSPVRRYSVKAPGEKSY